MQIIYNSACVDGNFSENGGKRLFFNESTLVRLYEAKVVQVWGKNVEGKTVLGGANKEDVVQTTNKTLKTLKPDRMNKRG